MLKKQTVWLLTMLSLMIVLGVYYVITPKNADYALITDGQTDSDKTTTKDVVESEDGAEVTEILNKGSDQIFTMHRMELQDERSMKKSHLKDIVASSSATTEEKNSALDDINLIDEVNRKESMLQNSILAITEKYEDVLVRQEKDIVYVHVKVEDLTKKEVVHIMQMVRDEFGDIPVSVDSQPSEG